MNALTKKAAPKLTVEEVTAKVPAGPWWYFRQNNSGGYFVGPKNVLLVAPNEDAAWERLRSLPDYTSNSCDCCGSRWGWAREMTKEEVVAEIVDLSRPDHFDNTFHANEGLTLLVLPEYAPNKVNAPLEF
jgi:hypothetical protein